VCVGFLPSVSVSLSLSLFICTSAFIIINHLSPSIIMINHLSSPVTIVVTHHHHKRRVGGGGGGGGDMGNGSMGRKGMQVIWGGWKKKLFFKFFSFPTFTIKKRDY
jgi:hypothetical protein